jgi:hypothetical protein
MRQKQLPWMLVPHSRTSWLHPSVISRAEFFCFLSVRSHKVPLPPDAYTVRYIGSYEGGWFVVSFGQTSVYALLNLRSGTRIDLPSTILAAGTMGQPMVLRAASLSGSPDDAASCVAAGICSTFEPNFLCRTFLGFSRIGGSTFTCVSEIDVEDVIFYDKSFYSITRIGDIVVFTPDFSANSTPNSINMVSSYMRFLPVHHGGDVCVKGRYLV